MSFKIHLFIISLIVIVVYFIWQTFQKLPETMPVQVAPPASQFSIIINHAAWGLSCKSRVTQPGNGGALDSAYMNGDAAKLHEDNVLQKVAELCNGKLTCDVPVARETFGEDPAPACQNKSLQVEYRCFSYDRPWIIQAPNGGTLTIDCDRPTN